MNDDRKIPDGWVKEFDEHYQQHYYVDTRVSPPRSIWAHPYEDEQFLREHPSIRERLARRRNSEYDPGSSGVGTGNGEHIKRRFFFGKIKDKVIGTKEEREAAKFAEQRAVEQRRLRIAEQRRLRAAQQQQYRQQAYY
ncbi:hypothetical protein EW145_g3724 [Phellinidium pouzarii]|uniref:WW domain-containing protein n=1 Tax=Phellinidium pouzarii TaxID=167371 RepID=A0A4S4L6J7_9AGAM|nr:hypothetical protein EW145_g3724 [Phellinidium pouzarii]